MKKTVTYLSNTNESIFNKNSCKFAQPKPPAETSQSSEDCTKIYWANDRALNGEKAKFQRRKKRSGAFKCIIYHRQKSSKLIV